MNEEVTSRRVNIDPATGDEPGLNMWTGEPKNPKSKRYRGPIMVVPDHHWSDGLLHRGRVEGTDLVGDRASAAWHERSAVASALEARGGGPASDNEVSKHIQAIKTLAGHEAGRKLLGPVWERYQAEAANLHKFVPHHPLLRSTSGASRATGNVVARLEHLLGPMVGVANRALSLAGSAALRTKAPTPAWEPVLSGEAEPEPKWESIDGIPFAGVEHGEPATIAAGLKKRRTLKPAPLHEGPLNPPAEMGTPRKGVEDRAAVKPVAAPTITPPGRDAPIQLVDDPKVISENRFETIRRLLGSGADRTEIIAYLKKNHVLTHSQAADTFRRWARAEEARRAKGALKLARHLHPSVHAAHDAFLTTHPFDEAAFGDWLTDHNHPNAAIVSSSATHGSGRELGAVRWAGSHFWEGPGGAPMRSARSPGTWEASEKPGFHTNHTYQGAVDATGQPYLSVMHRVRQPLEHYQLPNGAPYSPGHFFETPVHSVEHLHQLTEALPDHIRDGLREELTPHVREAENGGHVRLARPGRGELIRPGDLVGKVSERRVGGLGVIGSGHASPDTPAGYAERGPRYVGPDTKTVETPIHKRIAGTALAYHLRTISRDFAGKDDHTAGLAEAILGNKSPAVVGGDPFAELGKRLKASKHRLADAYNWHTMDQSLRRDHQIESLVGSMIKKPEKMGDREYWDHVRKQFGGAEPGHPQYEEFWRRIRRHVADRPGVWGGAQPDKPEAFLRAVRDSMARIVDRHLDREYIAAVAKDKRNSESHQLGDLNWEGVMDRKATGAHRFSRVAH